MSEKAVLRFKDEHGKWQETEVHGLRIFLDGRELMSTGDLTSFEEEDEEANEEAAFLARAMFNRVMRAEAEKVAESSDTYQLMSTENLPTRKDDPYFYGRGANVVLDRMWERSQEKTLHCKSCGSGAGVEGTTSLRAGASFHIAKEGYECGVLVARDRDPRLAEIRKRCEAEGRSLRDECAELSADGHPAALHVWPKEEIPDEPIPYSLHPRPSGYGIQRVQPAGWGVGGAFDDGKVVVAGCGGGGGGGGGGAAGGGRGIAAGIGRASDLVVIDDPLKKSIDDHVDALLYAVKSMMLDTCEGESLDEMARALGLPVRVSNSVESDQEVRLRVAKEVEAKRSRGECLPFHLPSHKPPAPPERLGGLPTPSLPTLSFDMSIPTLKLPI